MASSWVVSVFVLMWYYFVLVYDFYVLNLNSLKTCAWGYFCLASFLYRIYEVKKIQFFNSSAAIHPLVLMAHLMAVSSEILSLGPVMKRLFPSLSFTKNLFGASINVSGITNKGLSILILDNTPAYNETE